MVFDRGSMHPERPNDSADENTDAKVQDPGDIPTLGSESPGTPRAQAWPHPPRLRADLIFGHYRLVRPLGRGGCGEVWEAENLDTQLHVALKALTASQWSPPDVLERFKREGKIAASVNHPRVVFILSAEEIEGCPVITMELMRGGTLQDRMAERGPLPVKEAVDSALDIIEGLEAAHDEGILHRDIKPSNCFLDETGRAKIGDFGISKTLETPSDLTVAGAFVGTPEYASPEQIRGRDVGLQSDIYAVGATLYALVTGVPPFEGNSPNQVLARIVAEPPTPFSRHPVEVPREIQDVITRAMAKEKELRFRSYAELRSALLPFSSHGLTVGDLGKRFLAYVIDWTPYWFLSPFHLRAWLGRPGHPLLVFVIYQLLFFFYFFLTEKRWGRSLGKYLLGLRVTTADGSALTTRHALTRTFLFLLADTAAFFPLSLLGAVSLLGAGAQANLQAIVRSLFWFVPLATMRSRNGYAGLHEILSGTRVVGLHRQKANTVIQKHQTGATGSTTVDAGRYGPYRVLETVWSDKSATLVMAWDEVLGRKIWIHEQPIASSTPMNLLAVSRTGLHWLQGARGIRPGRTIGNTEGELDMPGPLSERAWDAYSFAPGIGFCEWVRNSGRLSWTEMRTVLLDISNELNLVSEFDESPRFTLGHIWIDAYGNAKLMNFPTLVDGQTERLRWFSVNEWKTFIREIAFFGFAGTLPGGDNPAPMPSAPMPEYARPVIERIYAKDDGFASLSSLIEQLQRILERPAHVSRSRRAVGLLTGPTLLAIGLLIGPSWRTDIGGGAEEYGTALRQFDLGQQGPIRTKDQKAAVLKVLSFAYRQSRDANFQRTMWSLPDQQILETAERQYPGVSEAQATEARRAVVKLFPVYFLEGLFVNVFLGPGLFSFVLTIILGSQPLLGVSGIRVQTLDGRRASRLRRIMRAEIAWGGFWLILLFGEPSVPEFIVFVAFGLLASTYAIVKPERGIPDLIARTYLVPR